MYWIVMSQQSDHQLRHLQTSFVEFSWFYVYTLSFMIMNRHKRQRQHWCMSWSSLRNKFPCTFFSNTCNASLFRHLRHVSVDSIHDPDPRASFVVKWRFDHDLNTVTSLMITDHHIQNWINLRVSTDPSFLLEMIDHFEAKCTLDMIRSVCQNDHHRFHEELSYFNSLRETSIGAEFGQYGMFGEMCESLLVFTLPGSVSTATAP